MGCSVGIVFSNSCGGISPRFTPAIEVSPGILPKNLRGIHLKIAPTIFPEIILKISSLNHLKISQGIIPGILLITPPKFHLYIAQKIHLGTLPGISPGTTPWISEISLGILSKICKSISRKLI